MLVPVHHLFLSPVDRCPGAGSGAEVRRFTEILTLERGVLLGAVLFLGGLAGSVYAVTSWGHTEFGPMDPASLMRVAIPSATALATGLQVLFGSFFLAMLGIAPSDGELVSGNRHEPRAGIASRPHGPV